MYIIEAHLALQDAVESGLINDVRELLAQGVDVNVRPEPCPVRCGLDDCRRCDTALMAAVRRQDLDMVRLLLAHGADPTVKVLADGPVIGKTAVFLALMNYKKEILTELVKAGADINRPLYEFGSYLFLACGYFRHPDYSHNRNMVEHLLRLGASANVVDFGGRTPVSRTIQNCYGSDAGSVSAAFDDLRALLPHSIALDAELLRARRHRIRFWPIALPHRDIETPIKNELVTLFLQHGARMNYCEMYLTGSYWCALELRTNGEQHSERFIELLRAADTDFSGARKRIASVNQDEWAPLNLAVLDRKLSQPLTLQALCVINVRRQLHSVSACGMWPKIDEMALPRVLSDLLKLKMW